MKPMTANGLAKLLEELGELSQVAAKRLAYFHTSTHPDGAGDLNERMEAEMADVAAACAFVSRSPCAARLSILGVRMRVAP